MKLNEQEIKLMIKSIDITLLRITQVIRDRNIQIHSDETDKDYKEYLISENTTDMSCCNQLEELKSKLERSEQDAESCKNSN